jgi:hypothetical protein
MQQVDVQARQTLRWLLLRGPSRRVWPVLSLNAQRANHVEAWLDAFRTRIFGLIRDDRLASQLAGLPATSLKDLQAGLQFALREGDGWLKFWIPQA